jgi:hypothetical protein
VATSAPLTISMSRRGPRRSTSGLLRAQFGAGFLRAREVVDVGQRPSAPTRCRLVRDEGRRWSGRTHRPQRAWHARSDNLSSVALYELRRLARPCPEAGVDRQSHQARQDLKRTNTCAPSSCRPLTSSSSGGLPRQCVLKVCTLRGITFSWIRRICNSRRTVAALFATLRMIVLCVLYAPAFPHSQDPELTLMACSHCGAAIATQCLRD